MVSNEAFLIIFILLNARVNFPLYLPVIFGDYYKLMDYCWPIMPFRLSSFFYISGDPCIYLGAAIKLKETGGFIFFISSLLFYYFFTYFE